MTGAQALAFFQSLSPSGVRLGLDRMSAALDGLRRPDHAFTVLHVAGTNGKGSTCAFAASCLQAAGLRVGLYTSPHLVRVNERFRVNGEDIADGLLGQRALEILERYPQARESSSALTFFEFGTLLALWHFAREQVDVAVLETGLGGRLDATTAARSAVTAITPISFDHMDYLGNTLAQIAAEKAGTFKAQVPVVSSRQPPEVERVLRDKAQEVGTTIRFEGQDFAMTSEGTTPGNAYRGIQQSISDLTLSLRGDHQKQNAAVAVAALELLGKAEAGAVRQGLARAHWPGRLEELPGILLDGAHNVAGVETLVAALDTVYSGRRVHGVFGVLSDKDYVPMVERLFPRLTSVQLTPLETPRSLDPAVYWTQAQALCADVTAHSGVRQALESARKKAQPGDWVLVAGSLFLVGEAKRLLSDGRLVKEVVASHPFAGPKDQP